MCPIVVLRFHNWPTAKRCLKFDFFLFLIDQISTFIDATTAYMDHKNTDFNNLIYFYLL